MSLPEPLNLYSLPLPQPAEVGADVGAARHRFGYPCPERLLWHCLGEERVPDLLGLSGGPQRAVCPASLQVESWGCHCWPWCLIFSPHPPLCSLRGPAVWLAILRPCRHHLPSLLIPPLWTCPRSLSCQPGRLLATRDWSRQRGCQCPQVEAAAGADIHSPVLRWELELPGLPEEGVDCWEMLARVLKGKEKRRCAH